MLIPPQKGSPKILVYTPPSSSWVFIRSKFLLPIQMIQSSCFMFPFAFKIIQKLYCCYLRKKCIKRKEGKEGEKGKEEGEKEKERCMVDVFLETKCWISQQGWSCVFVDSRGQRWQGRWELNTQKASGTLSQAQCLKPALVWGSLTPARRSCLVREDTSAV